MKAITQKQACVLQFLREGRDQGRMPTFREISARFGRAGTGTARTHIGHLVKKGFVQYGYFDQRGIELLPKAEDFTYKVLLKR